MNGAHAMTMQMVHEDDELYSVTEMATLLFGNQDPTSCYASHRLLSQERIFFKQAGRSPPRFQARSAKEVHALKAKRAADEKVSTDVDLAMVSHFLIAAFRAAVSCCFWVQRLSS